MSSKLEKARKELLSQTRPLKRKDIRPCDRCGAQIGPAFYLVEVSQAIINPAGARQAISEEAMMGPLAGVMGTDPEIARALPPVKRLLCQECALSISLAEAWTGDELWFNADSKDD